MCQRTMRWDGIEEEGNLFDAQELNGSPNESRRTPVERRNRKDGNLVKLTSPVTEVFRKRNSHESPG